MAKQDGKQDGAISDVSALQGKIEKVKEMPLPRRGRRPMDLSYLIDQLNDKQGHAIRPIENDTEKNRYSRWLRAAATQAGLDVEAVYLPDEAPPTLYFRGYDKGQAPKRGRRGTGTTVAKSRKVESANVA